MAAEGPRLAGDIGGGGPHCVLAEETRKNSEEMAALRSCASGAVALFGRFQGFQCGFPSGGKKAVAPHLTCASALPQSRKPPQNRGEGATGPAPSLEAAQWQSVWSSSPLLLKLWSVDRRHRLPWAACQTLGTSGPSLSLLVSKTLGDSCAHQSLRSTGPVQMPHFTNEENESWGEEENHPSSFRKCNSQHGSDSSPRPWSGTYCALLNCPPLGGIALCLLTGEATRKTGTQRGRWTTQEGGRQPLHSPSAALDKLWAPGWPLHRAQVCFQGWHSEPGPARQPGAQPGSADGPAPPSLSALHLLLCVHCGSGVPGQVAALGGPARQRLRQKPGVTSGS